MIAPIVFIHNISGEAEAAWLQAFLLLLPNETIILPAQVAEQQRAEVEIAITANPDPEVIAQFPNLILLQSLWAGVETLVEAIRYLQAQGRVMDIKLIRLVDPQLARNMSEAVLAWTLYLHRLMPEYARQQRLKIWQALQCPTAEQLRVSVLGAGELGMAAITALVKQGYTVNSWSRTEKKITDVKPFCGLNQLPDILKQSDIVICLLPLTEHTQGILNRNTFENLPKGAKLINFSRGGVVNHRDLISCLDQGHMAHAVLDVFEQEPLLDSSPLWEHSKVTVLPHISAMTTIATASKIAAENIIEYRSSGVIPREVDMSVGY